MLLTEIPKLYSNEIDCKFFFKTLREKIGISCKKCGCTKHYWLKAKWQWQCTKCQFRTTLRSGTGIHHSHLTFKLWFECMTLMIAFKKGLSAKEMQRQLGHKRYRTVWYMMHRIRASMGREESKIFQRMLKERNFCDSTVRTGLKINSLPGKNKTSAFVFNRLILTLKQDIKYNSRGCTPAGKDQTFYLAFKREDQMRILRKFMLISLSQEGTKPTKKHSKWNQILRRSFVNQMAGIHQRIKVPSHKVCKLKSYSENVSDLLLKGR